MRLSPQLILCSTLISASAVPAIDNPQPAEDIVTTAKADGGYATFVAAVRAARLEEVLRSEGPFTVLIPTDAAFAALPESLLAELLRPESRDRLATILRCHVIAGRVSAVEALAARSATTLAGEKVNFGLERGQLTISGAAVVANDIEASNGLVHAIDRVLLPPQVAPLPSTSAALIEFAVERAVPIFNEGQPAACAAIYEVTALSLLAHSVPPLTPPVRQLLEAAVRDPRSGDSREKAWRLRRALDAARASLRKPVSEPDVVDSSSIDAFDGAGRQSDWRVVNDTVMGGRSSSTLAVDGKGSGIFAGEVSLENNGGFASVRRSVAAGSLSGFDGIAIRVRGDGQRYRFNVSNRGEVTPDLYQSDFATEDGEWTEIRVPFTSMERSVMGFRPPNSTPVDPAKIRSIGVSIGDKQAGTFRLEIDWLRGYREDRS